MTKDTISKHAKYRKLLNKLSPKLKAILEKDTNNLTINEVDNQIIALNGNIVPFCESTQEIFNKGLVCTTKYRIPRGSLKMFGVDVAELDEKDYWEFLKIKYGWVQGT